MVELMLLAQLSTEPLGEWITVTATAAQCKHYANSNGYKSFIWLPVKLAEGGDCYGLGKKRHRIEALEYEIDRGNK